jgi:Trypsin-like serine proteases, typically periplasmic, contain C-terminal PDZ domain
MAYSVKPAVVRVSAYAEATFRYPPGAITAISNELKRRGIEAAVSGLPQDISEVHTGAGGSGSGFIVHPAGFILTSGHVVAPTRDAGKLQAELARNGAIAALLRHLPIDVLRSLYRDGQLDELTTELASKGSVVGSKMTNRVEVSNGETWPFRVVRYSPSLTEGGSDLALLKIEARSPLPTIRFGDSDAVRVGTTIWAVGYPAVASSTDDVIGGWLSADSDLEPTFNPGTITAIKRNVLHKPVFQTNVAIYRGNSGGPAINGSGEVIGISTWGHSAAEQIKFLVPANIAREMTSDAGVALDQQSDFDRFYGKALDCAWDGRWIEARDQVRQASKRFHNSPDVIRLSNDINHAIDGLPLWKRYRGVTTLAIAVAVLLVIAGATLAANGRTPVRAVAAMTSDVHVRPAPRDDDAIPAETRSGEPGEILGRFTILNGDRAGEKLGLGGSGIRIGREETLCEIVLTNPKVSRLHAEIVAIDGRVMLVDRNSSNGTYVNDRKIERQFLKNGDIIYFGGRNAIAVAFHA